jgi:hypothetical protein
VRTLICRQSRQGPARLYQRDRPPQRFPSSCSAAATSQGAGIFNDSLLKLDGVRVSSNRGKATGPSGVAQGAGVWNGTDISGPPVRLALNRTILTRNSLTGSPSITLQGAGLFTELPVTLRHSLIARNTPDQCFGCTGLAPSPVG